MFKQVIENLIANGYAETHAGYHPNYYWVSEKGEYFKGAYAHIAEPYDGTRRIYADSYKELLLKLLPDYCSVTEAATWAGFNRSYIKAEIKRGNLKATKIAGYVIKASDFIEWLDTPKRGNRKKVSNEL